VSAFSTRFILNDHQSAVILATTKTPRPWSMTFGRCSDPFDSSPLDGYQVLMTGLSKSWICLKSCVASASRGRLS
jgi:hypothetical protein